MSINLSTFWTTWGVFSGDTTSTNQYDFWRGLIMTGGTRMNNQYDFFTFNNTTRYEFFKNLNSTYPEVWDETTFYQNTNDVRIYDYKTFYEFAAQSLPTGGPTPTPVPPTATPTPTPTPTPSPTPITPVAFDFAKELLFADCNASSPDSTYYTAGIPILADGITLYTDNTLTTPVNGLAGLYYTYFVGGTPFSTMEISSVGVISNYVNCPTPTPTPTISPTPTPTPTPSPTAIVTYNLLTEDSDNITTEAGNVIDYEY